LLRVLRIFTESSISLGLIWRQLESRDSVHARLKLPDKELRYLRIVRVTTAVYRSLFSRAHSIHFTDQHRAGVSPYMSTQRVIHRPVFLLNSRSLLFTAGYFTSFLLAAFYCGLLTFSLLTDSIIKSILPNSFKSVLPYA